MCVRENSRNFPVEELEPPEGLNNCKKHNMLSIVVGPEDLGWPVLRKRKLTVGYNPKTLIWMGPHQDHIQRDFMMKFHRGRACDGDVFYQDSDGHIREEYQFAARKRSVNLDLRPEEWQKFDPASVLTLGAKRRLLNHEHILEHALASLEGAEAAKTYISDVQQSGTFTTIGEELGCLATHGTHWNHSRGRWLTAWEALAAQGCDVLRGRRSTCLVKHQLERVSIPERMHMAGNGQHLHAMMAWVTYVACHLVRRDMASSVALTSENRISTRYFDSLIIDIKGPSGLEPDNASEDATPAASQKTPNKRKDADAVEKNIPSKAANGKFNIRRCKSRLAIDIPGEETEAEMGTKMDTQMEESVACGSKDSKASAEK